MRVLVFENHWSGHRLVYLRHLVHALARIDVETTVVVARDLPRRQEFKVLLEDHLPQSITIEPSLAPPPPNQLGRAGHQWNELRRAVRHYRPDHLYVPTGDGLSQAIGTFEAYGLHAFPRDLEAETAIHLLSPAYPATRIRRRAKVRASLFGHTRAPWTRLHLVDAYAWEWVLRKGGSLARRAVVLPDPIDTPPRWTKLEARRRLSIPEDGRYIGCGGIMSPRKGIDRLMRAFKNAPLRPNDRLLLVGQFAPEIRNMVHGELSATARSGRLVMIDRYVSMEELHAALAAMDVVCTPYPQHLGIASIMLRAAAAERPVLSSTFGWLGLTAERFGLGWTCDLSRPDALEESLAESLDRAQTFRPSVHAADLLAFHHPKNFASAWTFRLRERIGLPPDARLLTWERVLERVGVALPHDAGRW